MEYHSITHIILSVLTIAAALSVAAVVIGIATRRRWPAIEHACWLVVLFRLAIPPFVDLAVPGFPGRMDSQPVVQTQSPPPPVAPETDTKNSPPFSEPPVMAADPVDPELAEVEQVAEQNKPTQLEANPTFDDTAVVTATMIPDANDSPAPSDAVSPPQPTNQPSIQTAQTATPTGPSSATNDLTASTTTITTAQLKSDARKSTSLWFVLWCVWAAGSFIVLTLSLRSMLSFSRLMRLSQPANEELTAAANAIATKVGLSTAPQIRTLAAKIPPLVWSRPGQPIVVLPHDLPAIQDVQTRQLLIAHEFIHIKRHDHLVRWLELIVMTIWWWCPLFWLAKTKLRAAEELACDAKVLALWPDKANEYGQAIVDTVTFVASTSIQPRLATGGSGALQNLKSRLKSIGSGHIPARTGSTTATLLLTVGLLTTPLLLVAPQLKAPAMPIETSKPSEPESGKQDSDAQTAVHKTTQTTWPGPYLDTERARAQLPPEYNPIFAVESPDRKYIAWVAQSGGLYIHDVATKKSRLLIEQCQPASIGWSPDGKKIAISGNRRPFSRKLSLVDVQSGEQVSTDTETGGSTLAWSQSGLIAFTTPDRRIATWDSRHPRTAKPVLVSPPGINYSSQNISYSSWPSTPTWSADGTWLAWANRLTEWTPEHHVSRNEIWVAKPDGSQLRRAFEDGSAFAWTTDGKSLVNTKHDIEVPLDDMDSDAGWPQVPKRLKELAKRVSSFQASPILNANRLWQNPRLEGIDSIEFTHRTISNELDEHFIWRADGVKQISVMNRNDNSAVLAKGWSKLTTPQAETYTFAQQDGFPRYLAPEPEAHRQQDARVSKIYDNSNCEKWHVGLNPSTALKLDSLRSLSGSRLNFAAIDWGRRPQDFTVSDYTPNDDQTFTVHLTGSDRLLRNLHTVINAGTMLEVPSKSYIADLRYDRSLLTIDNQNRPIRERDYVGDELLAEIEFKDWTNTAAGQHAPQTIVMDFPTRNFRVKLSFHVTEEGLWMLKSGTSKFKGEEEQRTELVSVKVNSPTKFLDMRIESAANKLNEKFGPPAKPTKVRLMGLTPFQLGRKHLFAQKSETGTALSSLTFMPMNQSQSPVPTTGPKPRLTVELDVDGPHENDSQQTLVLYDEKYMPTYTASISTLAANQKNAAELLQPILNKNKLWLLKYDQQLPRVSYECMTRHGKNRQSNRAFSTNSPARSVGQARGTQIRLALDAMRQDPKAWRVAVAFSATWNGRAVNVWGMTGPEYEHGFGINNATSLTAKQTAMVLLVTDAKTGLPLIERSEGRETQFLDYIEATPAQFVPLRLVCRDGEIEQDFRFQLLNQQHWLLDHVEPATATSSRIIEGSVLIDGAAPESRKVAATPAQDVQPVRWQDIVQRKPLRPDDEFSKRVANEVEPWRLPELDCLSQLFLEDSDDGYVIRCELKTPARYWDSLVDTKYWTLTHHANNTATAVICDQSLRITAPTVSAAPFAATERQQLHEIPLAKQFTYSANSTASPLLRLLRYSVDRSPEGTVVTPEIFSKFYYKQHYFNLLAVVVNGDGVVVDARRKDHTFRTHGEPHASPVRFVMPKTVAGDRMAILFGRQSQVTGAPNRQSDNWTNTGSDNVAMFDIHELLANENPTVREAGLRFLHNYRRTHPPTLEKHRDAIARILNARGKDDTIESLILACCLAGCAEDHRFMSDLSQLRKHADPKVRDAVTVGVGMFKTSVISDRVRELDKLPYPEASAQDALTWRLIEGAQWALNRHNEESTKNSSIELDWPLVRPR
ncbi:hypothetical protein OAH18_00140 [bacterium]|nr:hypothetical protein [bacterium]